MKNILTFLVSLLFAVLICLLIVYGEDREIARQDFEKCWNSGKGQVTGCLFESNCNHFNKMLEN